MNTLEPFAFLTLSDNHNKEIAEWKYFKVKSDTSYGKVFCHLHIEIAFLVHKILQKDLEADFKVIIYANLVVLIENVSTNYLYPMIHIVIVVHLVHSPELTKSQLSKRSIRLRIYKNLLALKTDSY